MFRVIGDGKGDEASGFPSFLRDDTTPTESSVRRARRRGGTELPQGIAPEPGESNVRKRPGLSPERERRARDEMRKRQAAAAKREKLAASSDTEVGERNQSQGEIAAK